MTDFRVMIGDCIEQMASIPAGSVDLVLTDPPYGTTACSWDAVIPFEPMWREVRRVLNPRGAAVLTASQPFTSALVMSNPREFKYCWVWEKTNAKGFLSSARRPLTAHEDVCVFGAAKTYNPIKWRVPEYIRTKRKSATRKNTGEAYGNGTITRWDDDGTRHPTSVIAFENRSGRTGNYHPTQKPVALMEYLIRTYTNEGDTVLDFTMGSGTTGVACVNTGRKFIGIEKDAGFFAIAEARIAESLSGGNQGDLFRSAAQ